MPPCSQAKAHKGSASLFQQRLARVVGLFDPDVGGRDVGERRLEAPGPVGVAELTILLDQIGMRIQRGLHVGRQCRVDHLCVPGSTAFACSIRAGVLGFG